jgi:hypothetical protein
MGSNPLQHHGRRMTALRMGSLATAGHHAAVDLEEHFPQTARYIIANLHKMLLETVRRVRRSARPKPI